MLGSKDVGQLSVMAQSKCPFRDLLQRSKSHSDRTTTIIQVVSALPKGWSPRCSVLGRGTVLQFPFPLSLGSRGSDAIADDGSLPNVHPGPARCTGDSRRLLG